jgi:hypothetical protein
MTACLKNVFSAATLAISAVLLAASSVNAAGLKQPDNTPLKQFGFAMGPEMDTLAEVTTNYDIAQQIIGADAIIRTGLQWDPVLFNVPDFETWNTLKLVPALARNLRIMPRVSTMSPGGYRIPTDTQWTEGLRSIIRMYGPNGNYQKGGTYVRNGRSITVDAHPDFGGMTDFELWNEPDSQGNVGGTMTPAIMARLIRTGSTALRQEALKMGFEVNVIGPGYDGMEVADIDGLWKADNTIFQYLHTLSIHGYSRLTVSKCKPTVGRCIKALDLIRNYLDTHGGAHLHLASTEGSYSGTQGTCLGPQVLSEETQAAYTEEALRWVRDRPYLKIDFWLTFHPVDDVGSYGFNCDSGIYDNDFYKRKLGVVRLDLTIKHYGATMKYLADLWR